MSDKINWMVSAANDQKPPTVAELQAKQELLRSKLNAVKIAYLNSSEFDGRPVTYEDLKQVAQDLIRNNYALQRLLYGSVKMKLSVAKLLRRGG